MKLPLEVEEPVRITNIPREFYDFEDFDKRKWDNYVLILPKYGEALSSSKGRWRYQKLLGKRETLKYFCCQQEKEKRVLQGVQE